MLALGAAPGALLPQRSLNEDNVTEYLKNNGKIAEIYDKLQLFDVFSSTWFNSIAVLLFISLIGCILPLKAAASVASSAGSHSASSSAASQLARPAGWARAGGVRMAAVSFGRWPAAFSCGEGAGRKVGRGASEA